MTVDTKGSTGRIRAAEDSAGEALRHHRHKMAAAIKVVGAGEQTPMGRTRSQDIEIVAGDESPGDTQRLAIAFAHV